MIVSIDRIPRDHARITLQNTKKPSFMLKNMCMAIQKCIFSGKKSKYQDDSRYALSGTLSYMRRDSMRYTGRAGSVLHGPAM